MNFLAHLFLSGDDEEVMIGNFMADHVKGKDAYLYKPSITKGILLHRFIDHFTDNHEIVYESKKRLYSNHHKYAPVIIDVFFDHFLASQFDNYSKITLAQFTSNSYLLLMKNIKIMPLKVQQFLPYMIRHDWLNSYAKTEGTAKALSGLATRTKFISNMQNAIHDLISDYELYKNEFNLFFPELQKNTGIFLEEIKINQ